jgi:hypothetical protein
VGIDLAIVEERKSQEPLQSDEWHLQQLRNSAQIVVQNKVTLIHAEERKLQEINGHINQNCPLYLHVDNKDLA